MQELLQPSFASGEIAPWMLGRVDLAKYRSGCKTMRNAFVMPTGAAQNRAGTQYIGPTINGAAVRSRLIPFQFNTAETYVLVFGDATMWVIKAGAIVQASGGGMYVAASPYAWGDLPLLKYTQSADVMTFCHPSYPVYQLSRTADNAWSFAQQTFTPGIAAPTGVTATPVGYVSGNGSDLYGYEVTAVSSTGEESLPSASAQCINNPNLEAGVTVNNIGWSAVTGAASYNVYKSNSGVYGFIGNAVGTSFTDNNIQADTALTVEQYADPFAGGNNPGVVEYHQQRLVFGATVQQPDGLFLSQAAAFNNFDTSSPSRASDAITLSMATKEVNEVRGLVSLNSLLVLTSGAEFLLEGDANNVLSPSAASLHPQSYIGCSDRPPLVCGADVVYEQARGSAIRNIRYDWQTGTYQSLDVSLISQHLFIGYSLAEWAWSQEPYRQIWAVRSDGALLSCTFDRDQEVYAWSRHDTVNGGFESVCSVAEGTADAVYFIVARTINGATVRYVERLAARWQCESTNWFMDAALSYAGAPVTTVGGLTHLIGQTVSAATNAGVFTGLVVSGGGTVTLPTAVTTAIVGLPITSQIATVDMENNYLDTIQGKMKRVSHVNLRLWSTADIQVGPDAADLRDATGQDLGALSGQFTGDLRVNLNYDWGRGSSVMVQASTPGPLSLLGVMVYIELGGVPDPPMPGLEVPQNPKVPVQAPPEVDPRVFEGMAKPLAPPPAQKPPEVDPREYAHMGQLPRPRAPRPPAADPRLWRDFGKKPPRR